MKRTKREQLEIFYDEQVWDHQTLDEFIQEKVRQYPEKIALIDREFEFTYQEMYDEINHFAYKFYQDGIKPDDKVLIQLPNCFEFIFVLFALFKIGAIPVLALATHRKVEIKGVLEASGAVAYIAKDKYLGFSYSQLINEIEGELGCQINQYILGNSKQYKNFYSANRNDYDYRYSEELIKPSYNNTALLLLSGGTTGIPKLIPRRHCDYIYVAKQCAQRCGLDEHSTYLVALPIAHNFPLGCPGIIGTLAVGGTIVICSVTSPDEIFPLIDEQDITHLALVLSLAKMCLDYQKDNDEDDISSLKLIQVGGALLDSFTAQKIEEQFECKLQQVYGIAEGLICMTDKQDGNEVTYHTQGTPISEYDEIKILDDSGKEVQQGEYGELYVRGPYTIYNYEHAPHIKCVDDDMYFMTGDKVKQQPDGNFRVVGRIKEMINKSGEKILPNELEDVILGHPNVDEVKVIGVPDEVVGEKICVCIKENTNINLNELRNYLQQQGIANFKLPDLIKKVPVWPLTTFGKIDVNRLKE